MGKQKGFFWVHCKKVFLGALQKKPRGALRGLIPFAKID
jgi:hypothetical protein